MIPNSYNYTLYDAQKIGHKSLQTHVFPRYVNEDSFMRYTCNRIHDSLATLTYVAQRVCDVVEVLFSLLSEPLSYPIDAVKNSLFPINPINGKRHFSPLSRSFDKFVGDNIIFPLLHLNSWSTKQCIPHTKQKMQTCIDTVVHQLLEHNRDLLLPEGQEPFTYKMHTLGGTQCNAYALLGGNMVVFSELIKEIAESLETSDITHTTVCFADGTKATVNLEGLKIEDVLGALVGHEMTHIASRHSVHLLCESIARTFLHFTLDSQDLTGSLLSYFTSRKREIESDITGCYLSYKAGYDLRGALYLQELFASSTSPKLQAILNKMEWISTHPPASKRLLSLLSAGSHIAPEAFYDKVKWTFPELTCYDSSRASPALLAAEKVYEKLNTPEIIRL